jgi:hypothetical protein
VLALVLSDGGDEEGSPTSSGPPPTRQVTMADWARQANIICSEVYDDIRALGYSSASPAPPQALPQLIRISQRGNQRLQALDRPEEGSERIEQLLSVASQAHVALGDAHAAWLRNDLATAQARQTDAAALDAQVRQIDSELGANICAQGP